MPGAQLCTSRKRRYLEERTSRQNASAPHTSKRQKRSHSSRFQFPPVFYDDLSLVHLTKLAIKELDRRNTQAALSCGLRSAHRPVTRSALNRSVQCLTEPAKYLDQCGSTGLKRIKLIARHGGPDLSDLRGFPASLRYPAMTSRSGSQAAKRPSTDTTKTASTGPYNRNFQQHLTDNGVFPPGYRYPDGSVVAKPDNSKEIYQELSRRRASLSPSEFSEDTYKRFVQADADALKEKQVTTSVIPIIEGNIQDARCVSGGIPFMNLADLTDGTLVVGNPDIYYGARPEQLERCVRDELNNYIVPSTQYDLPILPNFFLAVKGPDGSSAVASRQANYDGALGARGMHSLETFRQGRPSFTNTASTISSTYHAGTLKMYTVHPIQPSSPGGKPTYVMHPLRSFAMTDSLDTFLQGATCYRNGRDWAKQQRDESIEKANKMVSEDPATLGTDTTLASTSSFTDDALSSGCTIGAHSEEPQDPPTEESTTNFQTTEASSAESFADNSDFNLSKSHEVALSEPSGLSQQFESQALQQEPKNYSTRVDLQPIVPDMSARPGELSSRPEPRRAKRKYAAK